MTKTKELQKMIKENEENIKLHYGRSNGWNNPSDFYYTDELIDFVCVKYPGNGTLEMKMEQFCKDNSLEF